MELPNTAPRQCLVLLFAFRMPVSGITLASLWLVAGILTTSSAIADNPQENIEILLEQMALDLDHIRHAFTHDVRGIAPIARRIANHPRPSRAARWRMLRCAGPRQGLALGKQNATVRELAEQLAASITAADVARAREIFTQLDATFSQWRADYQRIRTECQN